MFGIIRSEFTKIVTLPSVLIVTMIVLALDVLILVQPMGLYAEAVAGITPDGVIEIFVGQRRPAEEALIGQLIASSFQSALFLPVIGAIIAGQEFRHGQIGTSVLAVPTRVRLLAGKTIATGLYIAGVAFVIVAISTFFMFLAVRDWNPSILWDTPALTGQAKFLLFAVAYTLTVFAITVLARRTLAGIIAVVVFLGVTMSQVLAAFAPTVDALTPMSAGRNLLLDAVGNNLTASPTHGAAVILGWAVVTLAVAAIALRRRDAR